MSLSPRTLLTQLSDTQVAFYDSTGSGSASNTGGYGYSGNISYAATSGVRLLIGNYSALISTSELESGGAFIQYVEYIKTSGDPSTYDNKTISTGDTFIPQISGLTVGAGDVFETTGRYNPSITGWLPTDEQLPLFLTPEELNLGTAIPDTVLTMQYEVYGDEVLSTFTSVDGTSYLVTGSGIVVYNSQRYREGESFQAEDASAVTLYSGTFGVSVYQGGNYNAFITSYNVTSNLVNLITQNILNPRPNSLKFDAQVGMLWSKLDAVDRQTQTGLVSYQQVFNLLNYIVQKTYDLENGIY